MSIFVLPGLLVCVRAQGTNSGTPVFEQTGKDLLLHVKEHVEIKKGSDFRWRVNGSKNVVKFFAKNDPIIYDDYHGRVEFSVQNYTLCLKKVQMADSGCYTAIVSGDQDQVVADYKVTVLDPVSPVNLTVTSDSSDCNFTVTCSTLNSLISSTFLCHNKTCSPEGGERSEVTLYHSMNIYLKQGVIICNHSNQVSWKHVEQEIKHHCEQHPGSECVSAGISVCLLRIVVISIGLIIMVSAVISVHVMEGIKKQK